MKYSILTFGCRTNQADSFEIERELRASDGQEAPLAEADVVVINTCSVTAAAEQEARYAMRRVQRLNPAARTVVTGCYATRAPQDVASVQPQARVVGRIASLISPTRLTRAMMPGPGTRGRTIHLLRVQTGCDESCSYCIVPTTRGPGRSLPLEEVGARVTEAAEAGFKEVMVTGVHLGSYGRDLIPRRTLTELVRALDEHASNVRFRLSAVEPMDVDAALVAALAGSPRFAHHFHLPLQHASDRVLSAMRRPYTLAEYDARVRHLQRAFPDAALGADVIVGFPGEAEADFETCAAYLLSSPLTYIHVFPFSPRPGTPAASLGDVPSPRDVRRRAARLREIAAAASAAFRNRFVGATLGGLTIDDGSLVLTDNYLRVHIPPGLPRNERVRVQVLSAEPLTGVPVS